MNRIIFGENLEILQSIHSESVDLIYIDPPFNTGKIQSLTSIKTFRSADGDRKGFAGNSYQSIPLSTKSYNDVIKGSIDLDPDELISYQKLMPDISIYYIEGFLRPRLEEAYRILKPDGSLYFHIDYREVHYCKILLDSIFGRESFLLAVASYNVGDGRVRYQLKKLYNPFEERDFWYLFRKRVLPQETREYVPKVIASIIIHRNAENFGFIANKG